MLIKNEKTNYLLAPQDVISRITVDRIFKIGHLIPSLVISIIIGVKILPELSPQYAIKLEHNNIFYYHYYISNSISNLNSKRLYN